MPWSVRSTALRYCWARASTTRERTICRPGLPGDRESPGLHPGLDRTGSRAPGGCDIVRHRQCAPGDAAGRFGWKPVYGLGTWVLLQTRDCCSMLETFIELPATARARLIPRSEEHTSDLQSRGHLVC